MAKNEKRSTRSQASISDYFSRVPLDLSPLKQARSAMRNSDVIVATDSTDIGSSTGVISGKKRSASPPAIDREESVERESKRSKKSADENEVHEPSPPGWKFQAFHSSSNHSTLPPPSVSGSTTPTRSIGSSPRARSVPPSIPTTPGRVPYLDLSKYRSPTKSAHRVRVMSVPPPSPPMRDGEEGEERVGLGRAVDKDLDKTPIPRMVVEKVERFRRILDHPPPALVVASASDSRNDDPFSLEPNALLKTPVQKAQLLPESMPSLTPLGSPGPSNQSLPSASSLLPNNNNDATTDPMNLDPPAPLPKPPPASQSQSKPDPRLGLTKRPPHLIPPQPRPLPFPLPSRSPTPPSQRVSRSRSVSVDPPIPALPYPLLPSTSNASNPNASNDPAPDPGPVPLVAPLIMDLQPSEKHNAPESIPSTITPATTEVVTPAPLPPPVPDTTEPGEKDKGKAKEQVPEPSKLPTTKLTKASRLRSTAANTGPSGVTRTRTTKVPARPTPISREGRVTRSSTAKSRQADVLKEKEKGPTDPVTKPKGSGGETGQVDEEKDGKDDANAASSSTPFTPKPRKSMGFALPTASSQAKSRPSSPNKPKSTAHAFQTPGKPREPGTSASMIPVSTSKNKVRSKSIEPTSRTPAPEPSTSTQSNNSSRTIARTASSSSITSATSSTSMLSSISNQRTSKPIHPSPSTGYQRPASLVNLSNALDRLNAPIPSRPSTSMGFNSTSASNTTTVVIDNASSDSGVKGKEKGKGVASTVGRVGTGSGLKKKGSVNLTSGFLTGTPSSQKGKQPETKIVLATRLSSNGSVLPAPKPGTTGLATRLNKAGTHGVNSNIAKKVFGGGVGPPKSGVMGHRVFGKVSQKSSLPVVEGSPVKGGGTPMDVDEAPVEDDDEVEVSGGPVPPPPVPFKVFRDPQPEASTSKSPANAGASSSPSTSDLGDIFFDPMDVEFDAKVHDEAWRRHASRRASYVMHNLSQSLSALPDSPPKRKEKGSMGPPPVPGTRTGLRSASSTAPALSKDVQDKTSPGVSDKSKQETNGSGGSGKKKPPVLKILKNCVVFVDVRTDEGDEAGGLFVEMLKGLGARTLSSVGQTCTHIVFKNGHTNTVKRYRELEHKPKVVGVAWVVECAEQRAKVDEENFSVDLDMVHIPNFGTRRRRSMLPKPPKIQLGDFPGLGDSPGQASSSFESAVESETSTEVDLSDLPPLERARRRSMLAKPHGFGSRT